MKYSHFILLLWATLIARPLFAQWRIAELQPDGSIVGKRVSAPEDKARPSSRSSVEVRLRDGYPIVFSADPVFKNFRNVTLADLDADGSDEIIFAVADRFFVYRNDTLWWSRQLSGLARFPVAVGDLENDGIEDLVVLTGFNDEDGQVVAMNARGIDKPGWPRSFSGRWMISSPALCDVDGDRHLEIVCSDLESGLGSVYLLRSDGSHFSADWPVTLPNVPAVTPSVGDLDQDGQMDIIIHSTREIYAFDLQGRIKPGWPFGNGLTKFSFQSPVITDLNDDGKLEIITEGHGELPLFIVLDAQGNSLQGWPKEVPDGQWTFHTPTVIDYLGQPLILTGRPISDSRAKPMLFAWRPDGSLLEGFPIVKSGGLEGLITVADIDDDGEPELIFPSNMIDTLGKGFIHAYELDGSGEVAGFPLRPYGWTYLNGATVGDVDGNGKMDLAVLTYTENPGSIRDSALLYVYELEAPARPETIWWSTYKGNNLRNGLHDDLLMTATTEPPQHDFKIYPNPVKDHLFIHLEIQETFVAELFDIRGRLIATHQHLHPDQPIDLSHTTSGIYFLKIFFPKSGKSTFFKLIR